MHCMHTTDRCTVVLQLQRLQLKYCAQNLWTRLDKRRKVNNPFSVRPTYSYITHQRNTASAAGDVCLFFSFRWTYIKQQLIPLKNLQRMSGEPKCGGSQSVVLTAPTTMTQWHNDTSGYSSMAEYRTRNRDGAGSTLSRFTASNLEQVAHMLCIQANFQRDGNWGVASLVWARRWRPGVTDWGGGMSASCIAGPTVPWCGQWMALAA